MSRTSRRYWRSYYRLSMHRWNKLRMAGIVEEYEEADVRIRMLRNHHGQDWTASPSAWFDDFPRARRTHGWKNGKCRRQWERRVRRDEKHDCVARRKRH